MSFMECENKMNKFLWYWFKLGVKKNDSRLFVFSIQAGFYTHCNIHIISDHWSEMISNLFSLPESCRKCYRTRHLILQHIIIKYFTIWWWILIYADRIPEKLKYNLISNSPCESALSQFNLADVAIKVVIMHTLYITIHWPCWIW